MISTRKKQMLLYFLRDKNKKKWFQIMKELSTLSYIKKEFPLYYISNLLYRKNVTNYRDYLSLKQNNTLINWSISKAKDQITLVENKLLFENYLVKNNIPTAKIFAHNIKNSFTYNGILFEIETKDEFLVFIEIIFKEAGIEQLFCKPIDGIMGEHIFIINKSNYHNITDDLIALVLSNSFIFQELIVQHETLKTINSSSINTLRIITYKSIDSEILCGFIRLGREGAIIDNAHKGGIAVSFDKDTGKMSAEGLQLIDNGGGVYNKHPDSSVVFDNFQIPHYNQVKALVTKVSSLFQFPLLGWDVAITPNGPIIIEVNHNFHLLLSDKMEKGLIKLPCIKKLVESL